jgi:methionyl aminopeptidase
MIIYKSAEELERMRVAGRITAGTLERVVSAVRPGATTADLDAVAEAYIRSQGATPSFKGYRGFPGSICASINNEIVHGIPSKKRVLRDGDILSIDVGVRYQGMYTDAATTVPVGEISEESRRLLDVTRRALDAGIAAATKENHVGDIGAAVQGTVEAEGFSVVRELVGHGVGFAPHEDLQVPNYGKPKRGKKLVPGLTIAIEPMVNVGSPATRTLPDRWTVVTADGSRSAHFEHTVAVTENGPLVLTVMGD